MKTYDAVDDNDDDNDDDDDDDDGDDDLTASSSSLYAYATNGNKGMAKASKMSVFFFFSVCFSCFNWCFHVL